MLFICLAKLVECVTTESELIHNVYDVQPVLRRKIVKLQVLLGSVEHRRESLVELGG